MPLVVLGIVCVYVLVVGVADVVALTVVAMLVVWVVVGPHHDLLPEMFLPRGLPPELLIWYISSLDYT